MSIEKTISDAESQMRKAIDFLRHEFRGVRTGRASTGLVENLKVAVSAYGSTMALRELASLGVTDGSTIVVKPFDPATLKDIQRAIETSDIGINPQTDGKVIRLPVPPLSTERRNQLVNHVRQLAEAQKVTVRNVRRDAIKALEADRKASRITEDDAERAQERIQKLTDQYCKQADDLVAEKSKDIMTV